METKKKGIKYETEKAKINMEGSEGGMGGREALMERGQKGNDSSLALSSESFVRKI